MSDFKTRYKAMTPQQQATARKILALSPEKRERLLKIEALRRGIDPKTGKPRPPLPAKKA
jgi:hypothetical protein